MPDIKIVFPERRKKLLEDKIDPTAFMVWFIDGWPESKVILASNSEIQNKFKAIF